jgi:hypothetical protein
MNQAPTEEESLQINQTYTSGKLKPFIIKIKTVQLIYIFRKVGLINQAPTEDKPLHKICTGERFSFIMAAKRKYPQ